MPTLRSAAAAALLAVVPFAAPLDAQQPARYSLAGDDVAIYDLAGTVRVVGGSGSEVTVEVTRRGPDAERLEVQTGAIGGRQTLRVVFPSEHVLYPRTERGSRVNTTTSVREDGTFGGPGGRRVRISSDDGDLEAWADLTVTVPRGRRVAIHLAAGEADVANVNGDLLVDVAAARVTTRNTSGRLRLDTGSGAVSVADASGELELDTGSGSVTLERVRGSRLVVDAGSGGVRGTDVTVDALRLDLGSGRTRLAAVRSREIDLDSGSGSVDLELVDDVDDLRIDSGSGSVTLRVPPTLGAELHIDTGSGGIETGIPVTVRRRSRSELRGTIGDGAGRIMIEAGSGSIRLLPRA